MLEPRFRRLLVAALIGAWLPLLAFAQGASTLLQLVNSGKPAANLQVSALFNAGKVPVGTTGSEGSIDVPVDAAGIQAGTRTAVYRDCEDEIILVPEGENVEDVRKANCDYDRVGLYLWGQSEAVRIEFSLGLAASALGAVEVAVEQNGQPAAQARVTIYQDRMVVKDDGAGATGVVLVPLEAGQYTAAVMSAGSFIVMGRFLPVFDSS